MEMEVADKTLEQLNTEEARIYIGGAIFVGLLMVVGFVGNIHVLYVFTFKTKASNHRVFILCLAAIDTVTCSIGMPFVLIDLTHPLTFTMDVVCKILRFVNYFMCSGSALVLVVIAVDRYRKICRPFGKQMSSFWAKASVAIALGIALAFSWPAFVLYGHSTVPTRVSNLTGVRCYTDDKYVDTNYMAYFNIVLILIALGVFIVLSVLYTLIGKVILKHGAFKHSSKREKDAGSGSTVPIAAISNPSSGSDGNPDKSQSTDVDKSSSDGETPTAVSGPKVSTRQNQAKNGGATESATPSKPQRRKSIKDNSTRRMTLILFLITAVFFISFIPHLVLKIVTFLNKTFVTNLTHGELLVYNTFIWCFFINNAANPIIYGFCDARFREAVADIYHGIFQCVRGKKYRM